MEPEFRPRQPGSTALEINHYNCLSKFTFQSLRIEWKTHMESEDDTEVSYDWTYQGRGINKTGRV